MRLALCAVLLVSAIRLCAAESAITFNGTPLGISEKVFARIYPGTSCKSGDWSNLMVDRTCVLSRTVDHQAAAFAGMPANIHARFFEDRLASVTVYLDAPYENVISVLFEAFGAPTADGPVVTWHAGGIKLLATGASDRTELVYRADWLLQDYAVRARDQEQRWAWLTTPNRVTRVIGKEPNR